MAFWWRLIAAATLLQIYRKGGARPSPAAHIYPPAKFLLAIFAIMYYTVWAPAGVMEW